jgi:hypothetical protein
MDESTVRLSATNSRNSANFPKYSFARPKPRPGAEKSHGVTESFSFVGHKFFLGGPRDSAVVSYMHPRPLFLRRSLPGSVRPERFGARNPRWGVVQLVGHLTVNEDGEGSNPSAPANFLPQAWRACPASLSLLANRRPATLSTRRPWIRRWCNPSFASCRPPMRNEILRHNTE